VQILITGVAGFVGSTLAAYLRQSQPNAALHGTSLHEHKLEGVTLHTLDLRETDAVKALIEQVKPDQIYHLAAQAFVPRSFEDPWDTLENNIRAQLNLILASLERKPRMLVVSSAEVYGIVQPDELPLTETSPLRPTSPYAVSKVTQEMLGVQYYYSHQMPIVRVRAFNHIGPGQDERFVAPNFAMQIAQIERGLKPPVMHVGDLTARRDFTDVRDVVRAYALLMERGAAGEVYQVASGATYSAQNLLDTLLSLSSTKIDVQIDPARLRPSSVPILQGDYSRLVNATGWQPTISFEQTLVDVLEDCRQRLRSKGH
jgi:GDP-4-dehydro-6-deoxy-D-mannose reductase